MSFDHQSKIEQTLIRFGHSSRKQTKKCDLWSERSYSFLSLENIHGKSLCMELSKSKTMHHCHFFEKDVELRQNSQLNRIHYANELEKSYSKEILFILPLIMQSVRTYFLS